MSKICWYFQIHQPWRLKPYSVFDSGRDSSYFSIPREYDFANDRVLEKVANKSYRPMFRLLLQLLQEHPSFTFTISLSGVVLEQFQAYAPDLISLLREMVDTGRVEVLGETYYHSLASIFDEAEFAGQVRQHSNLVQALFDVQPTMFRNTELIYSNDVARQVAALGFQGILTEGADRVLAGRTPTRVYRSSGEEALPLLLKHYQLSDDVAFRFSQCSWAAWPLRAETYTHWLTGPYGDDDIINLFMDFETFGEHQWEDTGIFHFFEHVTRWVEHSHQAEFVTPSQVVARHEPVDVFDTSSPISWADVDRDLTAWLGNPFQNDTIQKIYALKERILATGDAELIENWRRLQTSDHFYYMCTKWFADGDVHAYFSPYGSPYNAYVNFSTVLSDLVGRVYRYDQDHQVSENEEPQNDSEEKFSEPEALQNALQSVFKNGDQLSTVSATPVQ